MVLSKFLFDKPLKLYYFYPRTLKIRNRGVEDMVKGMIIRIAGADRKTTKKQVRLLKKYLISLGKKVTVSKPYTKKEKKDFLEFIKGLDKISIMFALQALHNRQQIKARKRLEQGEIIITDCWSEFCSAWISGLDLKERHALSWSEETFFTNPTINFLLLTEIKEKNSLRDFLVPISKQTWQKTLVGLSNRKPEVKKWIVIHESLDNEKIHNQIKERLSFYPELKNILLTHKDV